MADSNVADLAAQKVVAPFLGALVSLGFIKGTVVERCLMFVGAVASSFYGTDFVAPVIHMGDSKGLVGLLLGIYAMPVVSKVYEVISTVDAPAIGKVLTQRLKKFFTKG